MDKWIYAIIILEVFLLISFYVHTIKDDEISDLKEENKKLRKENKTLKYNKQNFQEYLGVELYDEVE